VLDSFHSCPIPELARLGRTLRAWRPQLLTYFDTSGVSNGGTEAINLIIEKVRRLAHGCKDLELSATNHACRPMGADPTELARTMLKSEDPLTAGNEDPPTRRVNFRCRHGSISAAVHMTGRRRLHLSQRMRNPTATATRAPTRVCDQRGGAVDTPAGKPGIVETWCDERQ
jgi:hypothetical protein